MPSKLLAKSKKIWGIVLNNDALIAIALTIVLVAFTVLAGIYNNKVVPINASALARYTQELDNPLKVMANWDSLSYINIALKGYAGVYQTNFLPLYPLLIRLVHQVVSSVLDSALIVSWLALVGAVIFYLKIIKRTFLLKDNISALYGLVFFVLFPTGVFLVAAYSTSLLAFVALGAIYFAMTKKPYLSALFCFFCPLANIYGVFAVVLTALLLIENKTKLRLAALNCLAGLVGLGSYCYYLFDRFDKPLAFISSQKNHGWLHYSSSYFISSIDFINIIMVILIIISIVYWWQKKKSWAIYSFLFLLIPIIGGQFGGFNRYCLMDFSIPLMAYGFLKDSRALYTLAIILTVTGWAYFVFQYAGGYAGG